jgi:alanyl-tRNA synthetase
MKSSSEIRQQFLDFFASKGHKIVASSPIVNKDDPTLMFTNAGMNQFKDFFLGNAVPDSRRIADTQKCLRVSGKHNDLEDVGYDGTHHTMFEMLGNWSIGDYFKEEALSWSWELLTEVYGLPKDRLYATVFGGDPGEQLPADDEARGIWLRFLPEGHVLYGNKKDNFWEMGDTGPCGPCSEIHVDLRSDEERARIPGHTLVNNDHPKVIEIWNNVFIQFNRRADGGLELLPEMHVDTGMGFERLCMVLQNKTFTYDTDIFSPFIAFIEQVSGKKYTYSYDRSAKQDIAMRVIADHIRAIAFAIADGQLPGNTGAGYVIRRILRRAVRYYYSFLDIRQPFLHTLIPMLADYFKNVFPELKAQEAQVARVIEGEELTFLHTLENGLRRFDALEVAENTIKGEDAFELYDTYGFPIDLTRLIAGERGLNVDEAGFHAALQVQKERSRKASEKAFGDWNILEDGEVTFVGYDQLAVEGVRVLKYRTVRLSKGDQFQVVLDTTPFYGESGGQAGDTGFLWFAGERIAVLDTQKENDLIIHILEYFPKQMDVEVRAAVDVEKRRATSSNHSAVHLMHAALHRVLGHHALQKGQDVNDQRLRFDFAHFQKPVEAELLEIEQIVNQKIRENIALEEQRNLPIEEARKSGAMMLFGEKYGDAVRMVTFDSQFSRELCGGTHVASTGEIGLFKIVSEGAVAAGIRRIEAVTAHYAEDFVRQELDELGEIRAIFKNTPNTVRQIINLQEENKLLRKEIERLQASQAAVLKTELRQKFEIVNGFNFLATKVPLSDGNVLKNLAYQLEGEVGNALIVFGAEIGGKPQLMVIASKALVEGKGIHAGNMVRELAKAIDGGGGGQPFFATAGGKKAEGLDTAIALARQLI